MEQAIQEGFQKGTRISYNGEEGVVTGYAGKGPRVYIKLDNDIDTTKRVFTKFLSKISSQTATVTIKKTVEAVVSKNSTTPRRKTSIAKFVQKIILKINLI